MPIVEMKRAMVIATHDQKDQLFSKLMDLGCVDISVANEEILSETSTHLGSADLLSISSDVTNVVRAIEHIHEYGEVKKKFLTPRNEIDATDIFDFSSFSKTKEKVELVNDLYKGIDEAKNEITRLDSLAISLNAWSELDVDFDFTSTNATTFYKFTCPKVIDFKTITELENEYNTTFEHLNTDLDQHYFTMICLNEDVEEVLVKLKQFGAVEFNLNDLSGTSKENLLMIEQYLTNYASLIETSSKQIGEFDKDIAEFEFYFDQLSVIKLKEEVSLKTLNTENVFMFEGWFPLSSESKLKALLESFDCAFEFYEPIETQEPPVLLKSGYFGESFAFVSKMYGMPKYRSIVNPNPLTAVFYFIFFGMMFSDAAYGLILFFGSLIILKKKKPTGEFGNMVQGFMFCGISTTFFGILYGGFFGDAITVVSTTFFNHPIVFKPLWLNPLDNPIQVLILSLALGLIQICFGMGLSGYRQIKQGDVLGAILDVVLWYFVFGGLIAMVLGVSFGATVSLIAAVLIFLTAGRKSKGFFGKLTGGFGALYSVTGYLSDVLSYARLLALGLATGVIAQVFNIIGSLGGKTVVGVILFIVVFVVGQTFNIAINALGSYIHSLRLQFVEFYGRFYEMGGEEFQPFSYETKYNKITQEEL